MLLSLYSQTRPNHAHHEMETVNSHAHWQSVPLSHTEKLMSEFFKLKKSLQSTAVFFQAESELSYWHYKLILFT